MARPINWKKPIFVKRPPRTVENSLSSNRELYEILALDIPPKLFLNQETYSESRMAATPEHQITRPRQS